MPAHDLDERSLSEASTGRLGEEARALLEGLWGRPEASARLPRTLRACRLWSRQRRLLRELAYSCIRRSGLHQRDLEAAGWQGREPAWACYLAELVERGLAPELAGELLGEPVFGVRAEAPESLDELAAQGALDPALLEGLELSVVQELSAQLDRAPLTLRSREPERLAEELAQAGHSARATRWARHGLVLEGSPDLSPWKGRFQLQDEASQLVAELVAPARRSRVIDYCAGAGGKSLALLEAAPKGCRVMASDVRPKALKEARRRAREMGLSLQTLAHSELQPAERVLVDAPCTGSGTLRRDPALRWRLSPAWLEEKLELQVRILDAASALVKPGGRLIYATCSLLPQENEEQVAAFLDRHGEFRPMPVREILGGQRAAELEREGQLHMSPSRHGTDGFFAAVLVREKA